jgi:hypothetical protein
MSLEEVVAAPVEIRLGGHESGHPVSAAVVVADEGPQAAPKGRVHAVGFYSTLQKD